MIPSKRTFQLWIPRYLSSIETKNYSENTIEAYGRILRLFARYKNYLVNHDGNIPKNTSLFSDLDMHVDVDADAYEIGDFFTLIRQERQLKPASLHQYESALSSFYRHLISQNVIDANPMTLIERPKIKDRELKYLRHKEIMAFIASVKDFRNALIIRTIYATGMRVSEICSLCVEHINFDEQTIRVHGKGGKIRIVFCDLDTLSMLRIYVDNRTQGPVFLGNQGKAISPRTIQHIFNLCAPPGITPHTIRHSYASELYKRSHNLRVVQENLGHYSIQTTELYIHTDLDERRKAYQAYFPLATGEK
ncbi:MAG TPA: tyrosine-type recombinase/integrase [Methanocorpusculum sp.]|nr:tyrosine-type recombinase/integrase [Methanocorpusculum sp.]